MSVHYPKYDGTQPCAQFDLEFYYAEPRNRDDKEEIKTLKSMCYTCSFQTQCLEWALHNEKFGIWGGLDEDQRKVVRRERKIQVKDPAFMLR